MLTLDEMVKVARYLYKDETIVAGYNSGLILDSTRMNNLGMGSSNEIWLVSNNEQEAQAYTIRQTWVYKGFAYRYSAINTLCKK